MNNFRVDLYTNPHKDIRKLLFEFSIIVAETDFNDPSQHSAVVAKAHQTFSALESHANSENTYAHPIIGYKLPGERARLEREHEEQEVMLKNIKAQLSVLIEKDIDPNERQNFAIEFYRALNRFIASYLLHIDEEEYFMQNLWQLMQPAELFAIMIAFKSHEEAESFPDFMNFVNEQISLEQRSQAYLIMQNRLGEKIFATAMEQSKKVINAIDD